MSYWAERTIAVAGGLGFIGSHFVEQLLAQGANVVCLHRTRRDDVIAELSGSDRLDLRQVDLLDDAELSACFDDIAPRLDAVVHCAALNGNLDFKIRNAARILDVNLRMTSNILNCARAHHVQDVVVLSSADVYAMPTATSLREEDDFQTRMEYTANGYAMSKTYVEVLANFYRTQFDMNIFLPRPVNVYGPRDNFHDENMPVIPAVIDRVAAGREIEIWGDGSQARSFVHAEDLVRAILQMVEVNKYQTLNISTRESVSILELVRLVSSVLGQPERFRLDPAKPAGTTPSTLDVTKMDEVVDFEFRPLRQGLLETAQWYRHHRATYPHTSLLPVG
ncbi:MAG TPA: SDR family oxidoreductase [Actinophytocola sp.]|nr:SDR family oxidoreductase [Actinophytocola sp.]